MEDTDERGPNVLLMLAMSLGLRGLLCLGIASVCVSTGGPPRHCQQRGCSGTEHAGDTPCRSSSAWPSSRCSAPTRTRVKVARTDVGVRLWQRASSRLPRWFTRRAGSCGEAVLPSHSLQFAAGRIRALQGKSARLEASHFAGGSADEESDLQGLLVAIQAQQREKNLAQQRPGSMQMRSVRHRPGKLDR